LTSIKLLNKDDFGSREVAKNCIAEYKLAWPQIWSESGWDEGIRGQYRVPRVFPYDVLIDPEGKIIATDLRSDRLTYTVREALGPADRADGTPAQR
jgi:hypothetical protein